MTILLSIILGLVGAAFGFGTCAFVAWELNPGNWTDDGRIACVTLMGLAAWAVGGLPFILDWRKP